VPISHLMGKKKTQEAKEVVKPEVPLATTINAAPNPELTKELESYKQSILRL
jgi:hypothetical protein